jgi:hypothetical protein
MKLNNDESRNSEWVNDNWQESKPLPDITRDFLADTLVLKIMLLMKQEEIDRKEMCYRIGDLTYYQVDDMSKVFLRAFSRAYTRVYGGK